MQIIVGKTLLKDLSFRKEKKIVMISIYIELKLKLEASQNDVFRREKIEVLFS